MPTWGRRAANRLCLLISSRRGDQDHRRRAGPRHPPGHPAVHALAVAYSTVQAPDEPVKSALFGIAGLHLAWAVATRGHDLGNGPGQVSRSPAERQIAQQQLGLRAQASTVAAVAAVQM